jgi:glycine cleavage system H lipoate-binding protein
MSAGVLAYQLCRFQYRCDSCALDAAMRMHGQPAPRPDSGELTRAAPGLRADRRYSANHCWIRQELGGRVRVGLEPDLVSAIPYPRELAFPRPGHLLTRGRACLWIVMDEATLALLAPLDGRLLVANHQAAETPHILKDEPLDRGWLFEMDARAAPNDAATLIGAEVAASAYGEDRRRFAAALREALRGRLSPEAPGGRFLAAEAIRVLGAGRYVKLLRQSFRN